MLCFLSAIYGYYNQPVTPKLGLISAVHRLERIKFYIKCRSTRIRFKEDGKSSYVRTQTD